MPTYRYRANEETDCTDCTPGFEVLQKLSDEALSECPSCGTQIRRVIGKIQFSKRHWNTKKMTSDGNLKRLGFKKLVKQSDGKYVDVLRS